MLHNTSKRPPRKRELISNQAKKVALVDMIFIAVLNKLLLTYYTSFPTPYCSLFLFVYAFTLFYIVSFPYMSLFHMSLSSFPCVPSRWVFSLCIPFPYVPSPYVLSPYVSSPYVSSPYVPSPYVPVPCVSTCYFPVPSILCISICPLSVGLLSVYPFSVCLLSVYPLSICLFSVCPLSVCPVSVCPLTLCLHV